jgi:hypothetical protein
MLNLKVIFFPFAELPDPPKGAKAEGVAVLEDIPTTELALRALPPKPVNSEAATQELDPLEPSK